MKIFAIVVTALIFSSQIAQAQTFAVVATATIEDDLEFLLDSSASRECGGSPAKRVSPVKSNYKPYHYYVTVWAYYTCVTQEFSAASSGTAEATVPPITTQNLKPATSVFHAGMCCIVEGRRVCGGICAK